MGLDFEVTYLEGGGGMVCGVSGMRWQLVKWCI